MPTFTPIWALTRTAKKKQHRFYGNETVVDMPEPLSESKNPKSGSGQQTAVWCGGNAIGNDRRVTRRIYS